MSDISVRVKISGVRPLLMHSARAANPLSKEAKASKAISSKRSKVDSDHERLAELDWRNGFYHDSEFRPVITADCLQGCFIEAAKKLKLKKTAQSGIIVTDDALLVHDHPAGPKATVEDFWKTGGKYIDARGVRVQTSRVIRYRPRFDIWAAEFQADLYDLDASVFAQICQIAGRSIGLCDYRPRFGLFEVSSFEVLS